MGKKRNSLEDVVYDYSFFLGLPFALHVNKFFATSLSFSIDGLWKSVDEAKKKEPEWKWRKKDDDDQFVH